MRKLIPVLGLLALALILAAPASATPIGPSCGSCFGNIYNLTYNTVPVSSTATTTTWQVTLTVNSTGYTSPTSTTGDWIDAVAVKVSSMLTSATLVSAPGGTGLWTTTLGGLNSSGCNGSGSGFDCVQIASGGSTTVPGGTFTWVFNLEVPNSNPISLSVNGSSIKVGFVRGSGKKAGSSAGITSEDITLSGSPPPNNPVPEPSSLALLGTGLVSVAGMIRRHLGK